MLFTSTGLAPGISNDSGLRYMAIGRVHTRDMWTKDRYHEIAYIDTCLSTYLPCGEHAF